MTVRPATDARDVLLFLNRKAGRGSGYRQLSQLANLLSTAGYRPEMLDALHELPAYVRQRQDRLSAVIAAGGDGTAEAVAAACGGTTPMAIYPLGTENLLAKYLGMRANPQQIADLVCGGHTRALDAGSANGSIFLVMLSCGYDAEVVRQVHGQRRGNISHLAYGWPILSTMASYRFPELSVQWETADGQRASAQCHWAFVFNAPRYAAGLQVVPSADPSDGLLDLAMFTGGSLPQGMLQFASVLTRQHTRLPGFQHHRIRRAELQTDQPNVAYQIDGDPGGCLPTEIECLPAHIRVFCQTDR